MHDIQLLHGMITLCLLATKATDNVTKFSAILKMCIFIWLTNFLLQCKHFETEMFGHFRCRVGEASRG